MKVPKYILPIIVFAQFCCVSLWFASNGVIGDLASNFNLSTSALADLTAAVQFGFISGTLTFAILTITDRFSPAKVFFYCALLGACANAAMLWMGNTFFSLLVFRFLTGFFLAGIYPVGMKIAADYFDKGLGKSLGFLVGALVIGTAFPHSLNTLKANFTWQTVIITTSAMAILGGLLLLRFVPNGPYRKESQQMNFKAFFKVFKNRNFRAAAFGYFGHMWELYTFWVFVPLLLIAFNKTHQTSLNISAWSFSIIAIGGIACVLGGYLAQNYGIKKTARMALLSSGICCLTLPLIFSTGTTWLFLLFLFFWGMVVIADSPLFSTLVAKNAPAQLKGTALTIVNCIGFSITIVSIQLMSALQTNFSTIWVYAILALGPIFGLQALNQKEKA